jgi:hypothetical protein
MELSNGMRIPFTGAEIKKMLGPDSQHWKISHYIRHSRSGVGFF